MNIRQQSTTNYPFLFLMTDSADHVTGKTGLTPTVTLSKNGAGFGAASGAVTELASGWYALAGNATDRATLGELLLHASATGADPVDAKIFIVNFDPFAAPATAGAKMDIVDAPQRYGHRRVQDRPGRPAGGPGQRPERHGRRRDQDGDRRGEDGHC